MPVPERITLPLISPLLRLQRQAMSREAYANATRQSWYEDHLYCGSIEIEHICWDGDTAKPKIRKLREPTSESQSLQECLAADRYLITMMPQEPDGSRDMERYLDLPVGSMNRATLVLQRIVVCADTFCKLFCISEAHDLQLLRWRKLPPLTGQGLWFDEETVQKVHRCRPIISDVHKELSSVRDDLPGADQVTPAFNLAGTEGVRRVKERGKGPMSCGCGKGSEKWRKEGWFRHGMPRLGRGISDVTWRCGRGKTGWHTKDSKGSQKACSAMTGRMRLSVLWDMTGGRSTHRTNAAQKGLPTTFVGREEQCGCQPKATDSEEGSTNFGWIHTSLKRGWRD